MKDNSVVRTDITKGEFSPSSVLYANCYRKFYYTKVLGLKPKTTPTALVFGTAIHGAVEKFYQLRGSLGKNLDRESRAHLKIAVVQEFTDLWTKAGLQGDIKRNLDSGILIVSKYCDTYMEDMSIFSLEDIETAQWTAMPNGTMLLCKMDRVLNQDGHIIVVDTKTTSGYITDYWFRQFENHIQTSLYYYTVEQLFGHCDTVMIDAIKVPHPKPGSKSAPFARQQFLRTPLQIEDTLKTYMARTDYILSVLQKPQEEWASRFYCDQSHCADYGGCPFLPICKHGLDHPAVGVEFEMSGGII